MLAELYVENFALIEKLQIEFESGLSIISGETGAGKSLLTDAVSLLVGGSGDKNMIRSGASKALVEATFTGPFSASLQTLLADNGVDEQELIISRELQREGKNICRLNGRRVSLRFLEEMGPYLLNQHSQMEQLSLFKEARQLELLDRFGGEPLLHQANVVAKLYESWKRSQADLSAFMDKERDREQRLDFLEYQKGELLELNLRLDNPTELEELRREIHLLRNSTTLFEESKRAYDALYRDEGDTASEQLYEALTAVGVLLRYDETLRPLYESLEEIYYKVEDIAEQVRSYREGVDVDPLRLEEAESRLDKLERTIRKYNTDEAGLVRLLSTLTDEIAALEDYDSQIARLQQEEQRQFQHFQAEAEILTSLRRQTAQELSRAIVVELRELALNDAVFEIAMRDTAPTPSGVDAVTYMVSLNRGEVPGPLHRIVSGGELSRILLALKVIFARLDGVGTMIFDEIDSGIGGRTATKVGEKIKVISKDVQVLAVTHSPLIAAYADHHYYIEKTTLQERVVIVVTKLDGEAIPREIARMLSGDQHSEASLLQAKELLERSV